VKTLNATEKKILNCEDDTTKELKMGRF